MAGVDVGEIQEKIEELGDSKNSKWNAIYISFLAVLLAVCGLGGGNNGEDMMTSVIKMSDTYNYFQAKNARQTLYKISVDQMNLMLVTQPNMPAAARAEVQAKIDQYKATIQRYESDPKENDGKKELLEQAKVFSDQHNESVKIDPYFDFSETLFQIAIVLMSVYLITGLRYVMLGSYVTGGLGLFLLVDAYTLFLELPFL